MKNLATSFDSKLIKAEVEYWPGLKRDFDEAVEKIFLVGEGIKKTFKGISIQVKSNRKAARVKATNNIDHTAFKKLAKELDKLSQVFFSTSGGLSPLGLKVLESMNIIKGNVSVRFNQSGLTQVTGQLNFAIESEYPEIFQDLRGIKSGVFDFEDLNAKTLPYVGVKDKSGQVVDFRPRSTSPKIYNYTVLNGLNVPVYGYWGFQALGTKQLPTRDFILNISKMLHSSDQDELKSIDRYIDDQVQKFNEKSKSILK